MRKLAKILAWFVLFLIIANWVIPIFFDFDDDDLEDDDDDDGFDDFGFSNYDID